MSSSCGGSQCSGLRMCHPEGRARSEVKVLKFPLTGGGAGLAELCSMGCPSGLQRLAAPLCVCVCSPAVRGSSAALEIGLMLVCSGRQNPHQPAQRHPQPCSKRGALPSKVMEGHLCHQSTPQIITHLIC